MSCSYYSEEELAEWDSVTNPIGEACYTCNQCQCEHWSGSCPNDCDGAACDGQGMKFDSFYGFAEEKLASSIVPNQKTETKE